MKNEGENLIHFFRHPERVPVFPFDQRLSNDDFEFIGHLVRTELLAGLGKVQNFCIDQFLFQDFSTVPYLGFDCMDDESYLSVQFLHPVINVLVAFPQSP